MRKYILRFIVTCCFIAGIIFVQKGHYIWGIFFIYLAIADVLAYADRIKLDLELVDEALIDEKSLRLRKQESSEYTFIKNCIEQGKIRKGMDIEELKEVCKEFNPGFIHLNLGLGAGKSSKGSKSLFYGYGRGIPTPEICFIIKNDRLANCTEA